MSKLSVVPEGKAAPLEEVGRHSVFVANGILGTDSNGRTDPCAVENLFKFLDHNEDGMITQEDLAQAFGRKGVAKERFLDLWNAMMECDYDDSATLDFEEFRSFFRKLDDSTNVSGVMQETFRNVEFWGSIAWSLGVWCIMISDVRTFIRENFKEDLVLHFCGNLLKLTGSLIFVLVAIRHVAEGMETKRKVNKLLVEHLEDQLRIDNIGNELHERYSKRFSSNCKTED